MKIRIDKSETSFHCFIGENVHGRELIVVSHSKKIGYPVWHEPIIHWSSSGGKNAESAQEFVEALQKAIEIYNERIALDL